jgi:hypothetical protein
MKISSNHELYGWKLDGIPNLIGIIELLRLTRQKLDGVFSQQDGWLSTPDFSR